MPCNTMTYMKCYTIPYDGISFYTMAYHVIPTVTYHTITQVKPYRIIPCHALPWCILHDTMSTMTCKSHKCHDTPYQTFPWHHMLCIMSRLTMQYLTTAYHTSSYAMPFHTLTYQASPWHTLPCYAIPWSQTSYTYITRGSHNQRCHQRNEQNETYQDGQHKNCRLHNLMMNLQHFNKIQTWMVGKYQSFILFVGSD